MIPDGLSVRHSAHGSRDTADRLAAAIAARGMTLLARIDHAAAATAAGMELRPTEVLIFGNPRSGTPLMQIAPTIAIDLPLKALVWQDDSGQTWIAHTDPQWLARRHGAEAGTGALLHAMNEAIVSAVDKAATPSTEDQR